MALTPKPLSGITGSPPKKMGLMKKAAIGTAVAGAIGGGGYQASKMMQSPNGTPTSISASNTMSYSKSSDESTKDDHSVKKGDTSVNSKNVGGDDNSKNINTGNVTTQGDVSF